MKIVHDLYCWQCCKPDTDLQCHNCIRSYHSNCANEFDDIDSDNWLCSVCINQNETEDTDKFKELKMLPILIGQISSAKKYNVLKKPIESSLITEHNLVNPINLTNVIHKSRDYKSFNQFYLDIYWIVHNCNILYEDGDERINQAKHLLTQINIGIEMIRQCAECFANSKKRPRTYFTSVCGDPHLIVWAKLPGYPHWPAKLMSVDKQEVKVLFFGDHRYADVAATKCYLYSEKCPGLTRNSTTPNTKSYTKALNEAKRYIQNIRKNYGEFKYDDNKTVFDPAHLDKYIEEMIPGIVEVRRLAFNKFQDTFDSNGDDDDDVINLDTDDENDDEEQSEPSLGQANNLDGASTPDDLSTTEESTAPEESELPPTNTETNAVYDKGASISLERIDKPNNLLDEEPSRRILKRGHDVLDDSMHPAKKKVRFSDELTEVFVFERGDHEEPSDSEQNEDEHIEDEHDQNDDEEEQSEDDTESEETPPVPQSASDQSQRNVIELRSSYELSAQDAEIAQGILQSVYSNVLNLLHQNHSKVEALNNEISDLKKEHELYVTSLKDAFYQLQKGRDEIMLEKENEIGMMQANHEITIESYERAAIQVQADFAEKMQSLQQQHADQMIEMERRVQESNEDKDHFKQSIEQKYLDIIEQIKKDAEESRTKCKSCKKPLQGQVHCSANHFIFCDDICENIGQKLTDISAKPT